MTVWRMAFKAGSRGFDMWHQCLDYGVAAITYAEIMEVDLGEFPAALTRLHPRRHVLANMRHFIGRMKEGDTIYAKSGPMLVGRGEVIGPYLYDEMSPLQDDSGDIWRHQRRVEWEPDFVPLRPPASVLEPVHNTILRLDGTRLQDLDEALAVAGDELGAFEAWEGESDLGASLAQEESLPCRSQESSVIGTLRGLRVSIPGLV